MSLLLRLLLFYDNYLSRTPDYQQLSPEAVRLANEQQFQQWIRIIDYPPIPMAVIEDQSILMRDGASIPIRIYRPTTTANLPVFVFFHGGGFVTRTIDTHDRSCRRLAYNNQAVVISVGYRLAPEHKFPTAVEDAYDATVWVAENVKKMNVRGEQMTLIGDSAGGNLATVVSILARDLGTPTIHRQVLIYPTTDARLGHPSMTTYGNGYFLTRPLIEWFMKYYTRTEEDRVHPLMSPLLTEDLSDLPPAFILTAEYDPLKDEAIAYAQRLRDSGNKVIHKDYPKVVHGCWNMPRVMSQTLQMHEDIADWMRRVL